MKKCFVLSYSYKQNKFIIMATTEVKRKAAVNKSRAKRRVSEIKRLNSSPVIKKVTPEEIKAQFGK